ncbi:PAN domain-containing protein [Rhizobium sp. TRM96647]|uniref:PAN domain-containing protein n=1 Tax=unclassified Rhizobium TaxID=2613769 RepID=UPI0021E8F1B7|nr:MULTISPECIES: PAN domain-containing protein [unclassified Rhizobium]MCV3734976.1 PAN domain-containing protein [Rhizobium sp. TRM96647]MCV3757346.1 PAN domain-containing protein [Rhizobium sp. TRM96650]
MTRVFTLLLALLAGSTGAVRAADIQMERLEKGALIAVEGTFVDGDDLRFKNLAIATDGAVVVFNSPGGLARVGMEIGRTIAIKGFLTAVIQDHVCASACGLAWIAGKTRFLAPTAKVGFHAVFSDQYGQQDVSSAGNALVGSYLQQLNLSENVIVYVTQANPSSMQWLTAEDARRIGLDVEPIPQPEQAAPATSNVPVPFGSTAQEQAALPQPAPVITPAPPSWQFYDYTDLPGYDLPGMPIRVATANHCRVECEAHGRCSAFTYNVRQRACFLKGMATEALQYSGAVSGYVGSPTDITRVGRDFGPSLGFRTSREVEIVAKPFARIPNSSLSACQDQCVVSGRCQGFSFYRSGICLMFDVRKPTRRNLLSVAGTRSN